MGTHSGLPTQRHTALRSSRGKTFPALPIFEELPREKHLLIADHTRRHLHKEITFPGPVIDRTNRDRWLKDGQLSLAQRATREV